jgi:hypothetical protein
MVRMIFMKMGKNLKGGFHKTIFFWLGAGIAGLGVFNTFIRTDNVKSSTSWRRIQGPLIKEGLLRRPFNNGDK